MTPACYLTIPNTFVSRGFNLNNTLPALKEGTEAAVFKVLNINILYGHTANIYASKTMQRKSVLADLNAGPDTS